MAERTQEWTPERSVAAGRNPWSIIAVISIATFMVVLDTSIANVALDHIAGGLSVDYDEATWVITSFLVANAIIIPISGWLADRFGRKRYYMFSVALFTLASFACGIASSLSFLVIARIVQGIGGGGLAPVEQSMMADTFPPEKRGSAFAAYGVVVVIAPILGPTLGGWITDTYSWHWVFLINVPIGMLSLVLVHIYVDEPPAIVARVKEMARQGFNVDFMGFVLVALFLGCLEVTLDRGQRDDWFASSTILVSAVVSAAALLAFIPWELTRRDPIVRIKLYGRMNFLVANIFMLIMGLIVFGSTQFIPQLLQQVLGYTAMNAGLALTMGGVATVFVMPISGYLTGRVDARYLIAGALFVQAVAMWNMSTLNTHMSFDQAGYARMIQAVAVPFLFVPITNAAYVGLAPEENNQASALMNVSRNLGGTFGISFVQTMLARREQFHQSRFAETLNPLNPVYAQGVERIQHALTGQGLPKAEAAKAATGVLYQSVLQQAQMLSYIDVFHSLMWIVFAAIPLVLLMQKPQPDAGAEIAA